MDDSLKSVEKRKWRERNIDNGGFLVIIDLNKILFFEF